MTHQLHMLRGDWILDALSAIHRHEARWIPMPPNHTPQNANLGRFHAPTQQYWPDAKEDGSAPRPMYMMLRIPAEPNMQYPGEEHTLTPTWVRTVLHQLDQHGLYESFIEYARGDNPASIAYYNERTHRVEWGMQPHALRHAALIASEHLDFNPVVQ